MLNLEIYNAEPVSKEMHSGIDFAAYKEDTSLLRKALKKYQKYKSIIIIGNGGSVNSFRAVCGSLGSRKKAIFLTTTDPSFIEQTKKNFRSKDTLVIAVSKSGETVGVIESFLAFPGYKKLVVTQNRGALYEIAVKEGIEVIRHPEIGGRFSGLASSCFVPALLCGIDAESIDRGARKIYRNSADAQKLAYVLYNLEEKGFTEIMCAIYSSRLFSFFPLIVQLMHETACKSGKGMTIFGDEGPEVQHHTSQRLFGGRKNVVGLFIRATEQHVDKIKVPEKLKGIKIRDGTLEDLAKIPYYKALEFEFEGTKEAAVKSGMPVAVISVDKINAETVGELMAFWQCVAVYSALLRGVNPYDQPAVEESKRISFGLMKSYKK